MTHASIAKLVESWRPERCTGQSPAALLWRLRASRKERTLILNEFVALTGYHRKSVIRLLRNGRKISALGPPGKTTDLHPEYKGCPS